MAGFVSLYYVNVFSKVEKKLHKVKSKTYKWLIGGVSLALLISIFPSLFGEGYESIKSLAEVKPNDLLKQSILNKFISNEWIVFILITLTMLLKAFATGITLGSGGNGGNFAPSLFVGAYLGFTFSYFLQLAGITDIPVSNFTIVAMAGILSGVFHAPLTAIFLIAEITGGYELIIPLMIVSSISLIIVKRFHPDSMDVKRLKERGTIISEDKDTSILGRIDMESMIEHDFAVLHPDDKLREVIQQIKHTKRNTFAVVDSDYKLVGLIQLNSIREEMFNSDLYDKIIASEIMEKTSVRIERGDDIFSVMKKFDESGQWNLPIVDKGFFLGFISKSNILTKYRNELLLSL
jgi:CIC family chloride channel protein